MEGHRKRYRLIVVGAGITGLSTALAFIKTYPEHAADVLVLEKNPLPGGCVTTFSRKGYKFDTTQIIPEVSDLLEFFGMEISLCRFTGYYARLFLANSENGNVKTIPIPSTHEGFEEIMVKNYPEDKDAISDFFSYSRAMYKELNYLKTEPAWYDFPGILLHCPKIIRNSNKTYQEYLQSFKFGNSEVYQVFDTFSSFSGLSGDRCAALLTACAMITTLHGSYRPERGFIQFPLAFKKKLEEAGAEVRMKSEVINILTEYKEVKGVILGSGERLYAENVVCTADTKITFEHLLGMDILSSASARYARKVAGVKMSPSGFSIQLGLDNTLNLDALGYNCGYNVLTSGIDAHSRMFDSWEKGELLQSDDCFHLAVICPSLMTGGKPTLIIHVVPVPSEYWIQLREQDYQRYIKEKHEVSEFYIRKVEQYMIPGLRKHILFTDVSTPATYRHYIGSPGGSQYDMLPVPSNFGKNRLKTRTPIRGLFVPKFSHGIWPSMQAGLQVVDMISGGKIMKGKSSLPGEG